MRLETSVEPTTDEEAVELLRRTLEWLDTFADVDAYDPGEAWTLATGAAGGLDAARANLEHLVAYVEYFIDQAGEVVREANETVEAHTRGQSRRPPR